ncbi:gluconolaconase [Undibacterium sp. FT79W]|nr:gluconolaconase [Undibacterium sp. FT79W]
MAMHFSKPALITTLVITLLLGSAAYFFSPFSGNQHRDSLMANIGKKLIGKPRLQPTSTDWQPHVLRFAGDGTAGKRDGAALQARFADPFGMVQDQEGNLYVTDAADNNVIRRIAPDGQVSVYAGGKEGFADGERMQAAFNTPSGIAIDKQGNLYVADTGNHAIRKISSQGLVTTLAGNGQAGDRDGDGTSAQLNAPLAVAVDADGNVYVADTYNDKIRRISTDGKVSTIAGGKQNGLLDGAASDALFDTPSGIAINSHKDLIIADTRNNAIRKLTQTGIVSTLEQSASNDKNALMRRPVGLAITHDDHVYIGESGEGRILHLTPDGILRGVTGIDVDFVAGDEKVLRLSSPSGLLVTTAGDVMVADSGTTSIYHLTSAQPATPEQSRFPATSLDLQTMFGGQTFPWPLKPFHTAHEVVGTMGEVRGRTDGEARDHFHSGLDIQGNLGATVYAVADEKVRHPVTAWGYGTLNEGINIDHFSYIHMKAGRDRDNLLIDARRFQILNDMQGKPAAVRIPRGTKFKTGDTLGSINRMYHVHLNYSLGSGEINPLALPFPGFKDETEPMIESIQITNDQGQPLKRKQDNRLLIPRQSPPLNLLVDAYDQSDDNLSRRRLGLYKIGYQFLHANGKAVAGYEQALMTIEFNQLPPDRSSVKVAYAEGSGITVHGNAKTRFLYQASNVVRDGYARNAHLPVDKLAAGDYILRIFAADYAGNVARSGRDLAIRIE